MQSNKFLEMTLWAIWWLVVGSAGVWVLVGSIGYFNKFGWIPENVAYWIQAVGSVLAILVAIYIARSADFKSEEEAQKKLRIMKLAITNIAGLAEASILALKNKLPGQDDWVEDFPSDLLMAAEAHLNTLSSLDLTIFPSEEMLAPFIRLKAQVVNVILLAREWQAAPNDDSGNFLRLKSIDAAVNEAASAIKKIEISLDA